MIPNYPELLLIAVEHGRHQPSQHGPTTESLLLQVISAPGEMERRTNIHYSIGYMEALQLIAGVYNIHAMIEVAPNASHKMFTLPMAYGPRVAMQLPRIIDKLRVQPDTRQAIVFIGKPEDGATNDQPCTTTLQFLVRGGELVCIVSMRSWDLIKGLPYDLMMFHAVNAAVAHCINVMPGHVAVTAASGHIYEKDSGREARAEVERRFELAHGLPREWKELQEIAQAQVLATHDWLPGQGMKHRVPPMFRELRLPEIADPPVVKFSTK